MRVRELAQWLGVEFEGDGDVDITGGAALEAAGPRDLSFINSRKAALHPTRAGCLIVPMDFAIRGHAAVIRDASPRAAFARAIPPLRSSLGAAPGIPPTAVIGAGTSIGAGSSIGPHVSIGRNVTIGEGCLLHAKVTIYDDVTI